MALTSRRIGVGDYASYLQGRPQAPNSDLVAPNGDILHFGADGTLDTVTPHVGSGTDADVIQGGTFAGKTQAQENAYYAGQGVQVLDDAIRKAQTVDTTGATVNNADVVAAEQARLQAAATTDPFVKQALDNLHAGVLPPEIAAANAAQAAKVAAASAAEAAAQRAYNDAIGRGAGNSVTVMPSPAGGQSGLQMPVSASSAAAQLLNDASPVPVSLPELAQDAMTATSDIVPSGPSTPSSLPSTASVSAGSSGESSGLSTSQGMVAGLALAALAFVGMRKR